MAFNVAGYEGEYEGATAGMSRSKSSGDEELTEIDQMKALFEEYLGEDIEGLEDFDWEGLWNTLTGEEEEEEEEEESGTSSYRSTGLVGIF